MIFKLIIPSLKQSLEVVQYQPWKIYYTLPLLIMITHIYLEFQHWMELFNGHIICLPILQITIVIFVQVIILKRVLITLLCNSKPIFKPNFPSTFLKLVIKKVSLAQEHNTLSMNIYCHNFIMFKVFIFKKRLITYL